MFKSLYLDNFKPFGNPQEVDLAPIVLIYGPNSSGKTSIIQSLMLIDQSNTGEYSHFRPRLPRQMYSARNRGHRRRRRSNSIFQLRPNVEGSIDLGSFTSLVHGQNADNDVTIGMSFDPVTSSEFQRYGRLYGSETSDFWNTILSLYASSIKMTFTETLSTSGISENMRVPVLKTLSYELTYKGDPRLSLDFSRVPSETTGEFDLVLTPSSIGALIKFYENLFKKTFYEIEDDFVLKHESIFGAAVNYLVEGLTSYSQEVRNQGRLALRNSRGTNPISYELQGSGLPAAPVSPPHLQPEHVTLPENLQEDPNFLEYTQHRNIFRSDRQESEVNQAIEHRAEILELLEDADSSDFTRLPEDERKRLENETKIIRERQERELEQQNKRIYADFIEDITFDLFTVPIEHITSLFSLSFSDITYLGPIRSYPQRFYLSNRTESVDEVGVSGEDTPYLIEQQGQRLQSSINNWFKKFNINYTLGIQRPQSDDPSLNNLVSLNVSPINMPEVEVSLKDVGFGIAQILPVIVQAIIKNSGTFLVEQPEIHLHPRLQAEIADLMIETTRTPNVYTTASTSQRNLAIPDIPLQWIVETHSETLMLRIQRRIKEGILSNDDVSVLYVHPLEDGTSTILNLKINEYGEFIDDWPEGFFDDAFTEIMS